VVEGGALAADVIDDHGVGEDGELTHDRSVGELKRFARDLMPATALNSQADAHPGLKTE